MYATALFPGIARKPPLKVGATRAALPTRRRRRETNPRAPSATSLLPPHPRACCSSQQNLRLAEGTVEPVLPVGASRHQPATPEPRRGRSAACPRAAARILNGPSSARAARHGGRTAVRRRWRGGTTATDGVRP